MDFHDTVSSVSHLLTAFWALFATAILLRLTRGHGVGRWAVAFFGVSMVLLYLSSALFHGLRHTTVESRLFYQKLDKSAVFLLIAGSYLPVVVYLLHGWVRRWTFAAVSGAALVGIAALWLTPDLPHDTLVGVYLVLGLSGLLPIRFYVAAAGVQNLKWAPRVIGPYLGGGLVELFEGPVLLPYWLGPHELMHLATSTGTIMYFAFLVAVVLRRPPVTDPPAEPRTEPTWDPAPPALTRSGFIPAGM